MIGYWTVGVPPCGAMDAYSFKIGNKLLGNDLNAAGIELTMRGGTYRFRTTASFCIRLWVHHQHSVTVNSAVITDVH